MTLFNCPECNKKVSDKVKNCTHCGYPLNNDSIKEKHKIKLDMSINIDEDALKKLFDKYKNDEGVVEGYSKEEVFSTFIKKPKTDDNVPTEDKQKL